MATAGKVNGTAFLVYVGSNAILGSNSGSLSFSHSPRGTTTKDSAGTEESMEGLTSWQVSCDGLVALDASYGAVDVLDLAIARTKSTIKFSTEVAGDAYWSGEAYIESVDIEAGLEETVSYSISFKGTGALAKTIGS